MNVKETVLRILCSISGRDDITEDMEIGTDIVFTSVNAMKMAFDLENELNISNVPLKILYSVETVKDLIEEIEALK